MQRNFNTHPGESLCMNAHRNPVSLFAPRLAALAAVMALCTIASAVWAATPAAGPSTTLTHRVTGHETLMDIARQYDLGFVELRAANPGVDPWQPGEGREIVIPTMHLAPQAQHRGIVVNLAEMRLYVYQGDGAPVVSFPIGIGREGWETPTGITHIVRKRRNPTWVVPASIRAGNPRLPAEVPPGPNNPLGDYALSLAWPGYVIHGTNKPDGIGRHVSHGCMRLYPEDIAKLFGMVSVGTQVNVVDQPVKLAELGGRLYLQVDPSKDQAIEIERTGSFSPEPLPDLKRTIEAFPGSAAFDIDWPLVWQAARERRGIAVPISR